MEWIGYVLLVGAMVLSVISLVLVRRLRKERESLKDMLRELKAEEGNEDEKRRKKQFYNMMNYTGIEMEEINE